MSSLPQPEASKNSQYEKAYTRLKGLITTTTQEKPDNPSKHPDFQSALAQISYIPSLDSYTIVLKAIQALREEFSDQMIILQLLVKYEERLEEHKQTL